MKETKSIPFLLALLLIAQLAYPIRARADGDSNPCIARAGAFTSLPNGDQLNVFCPVSGGVQLFRVFDLVLPDGYTYGSALAIAIIQNSKAVPVITEGGFIKVSFIATSLEPGSNYTILYREQNDPTWIPLKDFLLNEHGGSKSFQLLQGTDDPRKIISGVKLLTRDGVRRVEVSVNFPGIFVLAQY